jgi:repressor LexA
MKAITKTQQRVLDFIEDRLQGGHPAPTHREIADHFGFQSTRAAACHLEALKKKGRLAAENGKARALRLVKPLQKLRHWVADIPIYGSIPAGWATAREQAAEGCISLDIKTIGFTPTPNTFALRVRGESMIGKAICDGDTVIVEGGVEPVHGQVVAALVDGASTLKTFVVRNGKAYLKAENPKYPDIIPVEELMIQGVFKALIRRA